MSDLRAIAERFSLPMRSECQFYGGPCQKCELLTTEFERAMRLAIEATARCEGKIPDEEYFADIAEQMEALLEAKANK